MDNPKLAQTTFWLDCHKDRYVEAFSLHHDQGGHEPTPEEDSLAPFFQDPSQRILALEFHQDERIFVMKVEILLKLAREHGGMELGWGQWRAHITRVVCWGKIFLWVSGSRLFFAGQEDNCPWVQAYDFNPRAFAQRMKEVPCIKGGIVREMGPNSHWCMLFWRAHMIHFANGGHDSIVFLVVGVLAPKT